MIRTWKWMTLIVVVAALIGTSAGSTSAAEPRGIASCNRWGCPHRGTALHIGLVSAYHCRGVLLAALNLEILDGATWTLKQDDGREAIQLFFIGNGLESGQWLTVESTSGGDGRLRYDLRRYPVPTYDERMRLIRTDGRAVSSTPKLIVTGCPPA